MTIGTRNFLPHQIVLGFLVVVALVCTSIFPKQLFATDVEVLSTFGTNNVAITEQFAYAAAGPQGIVIVNLNTLTIAGVVAPPAGSGRVDDVSIDGDLLFLMDGGAGRLSVLSIENPIMPTVVSSPVFVNVSPFAGVSAANGRVAVSGGTGLMSVRSYDSDGVLTGPVSTIDLGIGQPDVLVSDDGETAFVSTDFAGFVDGQSFGITVVDISGAPLSILDRVGIAGAGFSTGTDGPANFPIESAIQGDTLFVASGNGVSVFDVSNPNSLVTITQIPLGTNPINVDVFDDTLYVAGNAPGTMTVIDVTDVSSPVVETFGLPAGAGPLGVASNGTHLVIADEFLGVLVDVLFVPGDVNRDGLVNLLDVGPFVDVLSTGEFQAEADLDQSGAVNLLDVQPFVDLLAGG